MIRRILAGLTLVAGLVASAAMLQVLYPYEGDHVIDFTEQRLSVRVPPADRDALIRDLDAFALGAGLSRTGDTVNRHGGFGLVYGPNCEVGCNRWVDESWHVEERSTEPGCLDFQIHVWDDGTSQQSQIRKRGLIEHLARSRQASEVFDTSGCGRQP